MVTLIMGDVGAIRHMRSVFVAAGLRSHSRV